MLIRMCPFACPAGTKFPRYVPLPMCPSPCAPTHVPLPVCPFACAPTHAPPGPNFPAMCASACVPLYVPRLLGPAATKFPQDATL